MTLQVTPEDLPAIGALLNTVGSGLAEALTSAAAGAHPEPAGADAVGLAAALAFTGYTETISAVNARGVGYLGNGSTALHPVSMDYSTRDVSDGADVVSHGTFPS